ncbi:MAG: site-specific integrase, partial [Clostridiaceae bacterium]|nr:site-specific integrase [Clostridiaceae bacterium]
MARKKSKRSNGEGSVSKRKDGRWEVEVPIGIDPETGKRKRYRNYAKSSKEANALRLKVLQEIQQGIFVDSENITVGEWLDIWMQTYVKAKVTSNTYDNYSMIINRHIKPGIGDVLLRNLTTITVQKLYNDRMNAGRVDGKGGLSVRSVEKIHTVLHKALSQAVTENRVHKNVSEGTELRAKKRKEIRVLSDEERIRFEKVLEGDRLGVALLLALYSGLRRGELLALTWNDIDIENETIRVNKSLIRVVVNDESARSKLTIQEPKTEKSNRIIPISTGIMKEIKRFKIIQNEEKLKVGSSYEDNNLVFCTELGKPFEPRNLNRKFYRLIKKADIKNFNLHGLRHTYATMLLEQDIHPKVVQEALGHTKISTTLDIYSHVSP